jgi:hypothetical protein
LCGGFLRTIRQDKTGERGREFDVVTCPGNI